MHWFPQRFVRRTDSDRVLGAQFFEAHGVDSQYGGVPIAAIQNAVDEGSGAQLEALVRAEGFGDQPNAFDARIECSSGTYIRSLVGDLGDRLGCGAHVAHLRRTAIGHLRVQDASELGRVEPSLLRPVEDVLTHLVRLDVDAASAAAGRDGKNDASQLPDGDVLVVGPQGAVGVFEGAGGVLKPRTVVGHGGAERRH